MNLDFVIILAAFLFGWLGTLAIEGQASRMDLVRAPNSRSSHTKPTPLGGGLAIAVAIFLAAMALALAGADSIWPLGVLTTLIAALGFADDLFDLLPALRFPLQTLLFAALILSYGPLPAITLPLGLKLTGLILFCVMLLIGLWWLNLFNFMDGIDGIAGSQAILVIVGGALIWWSAQPEASPSPVFVLALASAAATAGFLIRNWAPARIFMGDAGSNVLALVIFAFALASVAKGQLAYQTWLILPAAFVTDATVTLLRRLFRRERPWSAHRRHGYQQLSRLWGHQRVTLLYGALTALWAVPLALAAQHLDAWGWWMALPAYLPLVALAVVADAGGVTETKP